MGFHATANAPHFPDVSVSQDPIAFDGVADIDNPAGVRLQAFRCVVGELAVYTEAPPELKDAMDLAYLTGQRPADVLKASTADLNNGFLMVGQGKTEKRLRIRLYDGTDASGLSTFLDALLERKAMAGIRSSSLITNPAGLRMSYAMLRNRWDEAREKAAAKAAAEGDSTLAAAIRQFQFRDIRPKAASEIDDISHASRLLGHSTQEMTKKIYRRVGEIVDPTK